MFQSDEPNGMRNVFLLWIGIFAFTLGYCTTSQAAPRQWKLVDTEKLDMEYVRRSAATRDPYVPQFTGRWRDQALLKWRISVLGPFYWDNNMHVETVNSGVVKTVGWQWEAGLRINKYFTVFQAHHSRHVMEGEPQKRFETHSQFPVEDGYGIRIRLLEEKPGRGIWN